MHRGHWKAVDVSLSDPGTGVVLPGDEELLQFWESGLGKSGYEAFPRGDGAAGEEGVGGGRLLALVMAALRT